MTPTGRSSSSPSRISGALTPRMTQWSGVSFSSSTTHPSAASTRPRLSSCARSLAAMSIPTSSALGKSTSDARRFKGLGRHRLRPAEVGENQRQQGSVDGAALGPALPPARRFGSEGAFELRREGGGDPEAAHALRTLLDVGVEGEGRPVTATDDVRDEAGVSQGDGQALADDGIVPASGIADEDHAFIHDPVAPRIVHRVADAGAGSPRAGDLLMEGNAGEVAERGEKLARAPRPPGTHPHPDVPEEVEASPSRPGEDEVVQAPVRPEGNPVLRPALRSIHEKASAPGARHALLH